MKKNRSFNVNEIGPFGIVQKSGSFLDFDIRKGIVGIPERSSRNNKAQSIPDKYLTSFSSSQGDTFFGLSKSHDSWDGKIILPYSVDNKKTSKKYGDIKVYAEKEKRKSFGFDRMIYSDNESPMPRRVSKHKSLDEKLSSRKSEVKFPEHLKGRIAETCVTNSGSRDIQKFLTELKKSEDPSSSDILMIFSEIFPKSFIEISNNRFGNYVIQKLIQILPEKELAMVQKFVLGELKALVWHESGCRVVSKLVEISPESYAVTVMKRLQSKTEKLLHHENGNHVLLALVNKLPVNRLEKLVKLTQSKSSSEAIELAKDRASCRIFQSLLRKIPQDRFEKISQKFQDKLALMYLPFDSSGNYVVQILLERTVKGTKLYNLVHEVITDNILNLSLDKYGSNVVEVFIKVCDSREAASFVDLLFQNNFSGLCRLLESPYGNYVVQRMLKELDEHRESLIEALVNIKERQLIETTSYLDYVVKKIEDGEL